MLKQTWTSALVGFTLLSCTLGVRADERWAACAERDAHLFKSIEEHGEGNQLAAERLADAFLSMLHARELCDAGREAEALVVYEQTQQGMSVTTASR